MASRGFLYVAFGARFVEEARTAVAWLRRAGNRLPVVLMTDQDVVDPAFDMVTRVDALERPKLAKPLLMMRSPFEETIFLDTDTYVLTDISDLFDLLAICDLAAAHAAGTAGIQEPDVPAAFYELNSGVIAWRGSDRLHACFRDWHDNLRDLLRAAPADPRARGDQPTLRNVLWRHRIAVHILPPEYNYRTPFRGFLRDRPRIVHGRPADINATVAALQRSRGPRFFDPFPDVGATTPVWGLRF